jgi:hypothetical protein
MAGVELGADRTGEDQQHHDRQNQQDRRPVTEEPGFAGCRRVV